MLTGQAGMLVTAIGTVVGFIVGFVANHAWAKLQVTEILIDHDANEFWSATLGYSIMVGLLDMLVCLFLSSLSFFASILIFFAVLIGVMVDYI